ncbi:MAG: hypothetical protein EA382_07265 [Spirochaetaceae bacterium]|nr:MAG: hypothetical protein EA382_07265 [Spirochaetaceae bacterium]
MTRRTTIFLASVILLLALGAIAYAQNPFVRPPSEQPSVAQGARTGMRVAVPRFIREWSHALQSGIADLTTAVQDDRDWGAGLTAFVLALVFGAVHIIGPGHGKVFALSYFASRDARPGAGLVYSAIVNIVDSLSAIAVVMLGYVLLVAVAPAFRVEAPRILEITSYSLIVVFGIAHLITHLLPHRGHNHGGHAHDHASHDHDHDHDHDHAHDHATGKPPMMLALSVGLIPCPVSTVLLVYGIVHGAVPFMLLMVAGVSIGGFAAMSAISVAVIAGRHQVMRRLSTGAAAAASTILEFVASGAIIVVGLLLLLAAV